MIEPTPGRFARRFVPVWAAGVLGVCGLLLHEPPAAMVRQASEQMQVSDTTLRLLLLVNPLALVTLLAVAGACTAHRISLPSRLAGDRTARIDPGLAVACAAALAAFLAITDALLAGWLGEAWRSVTMQSRATPVMPAMLTGVLYGGLAEEVMSRWGLMSLVAWTLWALRRRLAPATTGLHAWIAWIAIVVSALAFAAAHLPALAQVHVLTGPLVVRTMLLNAVAGGVYGWLFWRRGLECAMLAHASTHVGLAVARAFA